MEDAKVPELRFRKEDGTEFPAWGGATFDNLLLPYKNNTFSRDKLTYENGVVKDIHYGDILVKFDSILDGTSTGIPYIEGMDDFEDTDHIYHVANGDIVIADTAEDYMVGKAVEVQNVQTPILAGLHTIPCHPKQKFARGYLGQYLNAPAYHSSLRRIVQGIKVLSLNKSSLAQTKIRYPSIPEQRKIALLFATIDERIALADKKITILHTIKKGMLQKIFSQELRFKDDDGNEFPAWKVKKLGDICQVNPKSPRLDDKFYYIDLDSVTNGQLSLKAPIQKDNAPSRAQRVVQLGDVLFQMVRPYQLNHYLVNKKFDLQTVASTGFAQLRCKENDSKFVYQILFTENFNHKVLVRCIGTGYPAINANDLSEIQTAIPSLPEQRKISDYFTALDDAIAAAQKKASALRAIKKGLLQKMFI